ncbi:MAG: PEP-utilizing enzyme [Bowdeniella nasicola]|nr:PEP-utilizing enzyme [Bowdeniella nasicola]
MGSSKEPDTDRHGCPRHHGIGVSPGLAAGPVKRVFPRVREPRARFLPPERNVADEAERIRQCAADTAQNLELRASLASGQGAEVLATAAQIAADPTLIDGACELVHTRSLVPARAVWEAAGMLADQLKDMGGYMAERALDVYDVRDRIIARLLGRPAPGLPTPDREHVLWARDLAPSDTAQLDITKVKAIILAEGGPTSHTAIVARELGIPAVVAAPTTAKLRDDDVVLVNGAAGTVTVSPTADQLAHAARPIPERTFSGRGQLACGTHIPLLANISDAAGASAAAEAGAEGIGLLRTELWFLGTTSEPSVEEQTRHFVDVFDKAPAGRIVVRALDAGSDKPMAYLPTGTEANPALGMRGYRMSRLYPDVLARQLEAIAAARQETGADVWVMAPMISTLEECEEFVTAAHAAGLEQAGLMIEVPAAALRAGQMLAAAQFASIGTNDLSQYAMAADRLQGALADLSDPWHPAVLDLISTAGKAGAQQARPVGVCGEAAADPALAVVLVGLGASTLSMTPRAIPDVAAVLAHVSLAQARELAGVALAATDAVQARTAVRDRMEFLTDLGL